MKVWYIIGLIACGGNGIMAIIEANGSGILGWLCALMFLISLIGLENKHKKDSKGNEP